MEANAFLDLCWLADFSFSILPMPSCAFWWVADLHAMIKVFTFECKCIQCIKMWICNGDDEDDGEFMCTFLRARPTLTMRQVFLFLNTFALTFVLNIILYSADKFISYDGCYSNNFSQIRTFSALTDINNLHKSLLLAEHFLVSQTKRTHESRRVQKVRGHFNPLMWPIW